MDLASFNSFLSLFFFRSLDLASFNSFLLLLKFISIYQDLASKFRVNGILLTPPIPQFNIYYYIFPYLRYSYNYSSNTVIKIYYYIFPDIHIIIIIEK